MKAEKSANPKNVLITGCSSGIGLCAALTLKERGYRVFATARAENDVASLRSRGLESFQLDLADSNTIKNAMEDVFSKTGGELYALFNNGAYGQPGAVEDLTREAMREQFEVNLFGTMELTNLIIPAMRKQGHGRIIQNSSVLGLVSNSFRGAYNSSKFALEGLTDAMRLELRGSGIHVSLIEPGPILTKFRENAYKAYKKHINPENSPHRKTYKAMERRLAKKDAVSRLTLPPEAVAAKVIHALESRRPRIRYYVTAHTYAASWMRRFLPYRMMDWILASRAGEG